MEASSHFSPKELRSRDGKLAQLKPGIAVLVSAGRRAGGAGGSGRYLRGLVQVATSPAPRPIRIHYGPPIRPEDIAGLESQAVTALIRDRLEACVKIAQDGLARDLNR